MAIETGNPLARVNALPAPIEDFRIAMLKFAGLDPEYAGKELRKAIDKASSLLHAKKIQYFSDKGIVVDERETEDNGAQLRAAEILIGAVNDMYPVKKSDGANDVNLVVVVNGWFGEEETEINVTPPTQ